MHAVDVSFSSFTLRHVEDKGRLSRVFSIFYTLESGYAAQAMAQLPPSAVVTLSKADTSQCDLLGEVMCDFFEYQHFCILYSTYLWKSICYSL